MNYLSEKSIVNGYMHWDSSIRKGFLIPLKSGETKTKVHRNSVCVSPMNIYTNKPIWHLTRYVPQNVKTNWN